MKLNEKSSNEVNLLHKYLKRAVLLAVSAITWGASYLTACAMPEIMPWKDIVPGMKGTGYTVFDNTGEIRPFDVDIIGVVSNGEGMLPLIMCRGSGEDFIKVGGALEGMSGSPIYVDGKLVGALAYGEKGVAYTFLATPAEEMVKLWSLPDQKNKTHLPTIDLKKYAQNREKAKKEAEKKDAKDANGAKDEKKVKTAEEILKEADEAQAEEKKDAAADTASSDAETRDQAADAEKSTETVASQEEKTEDKQDADVEASDAQSSAQDENAEKAQGADDGASEEQAAEGGASDAQSSAQDENAADGKETASSAEESSAAAGDDTAKGGAASDKTQEKVRLCLSGFDEAGQRYLVKSLGLDSSKYEFTSSLGGVSQFGTDYAATLAPGGVVGAALTYGDFNLAATGTVTAVDGKRIIAFGHPFQHKGNVNYFMTNGDVVGTMSGPSVAMKVANIGKIIGRISQDREAGISGTIGDFPSVVPMKIHVTDHTIGREKTYGVRIAYDEDILSQLAATLTYASMSRTTDTLGGSTAKVDFTIRTNAAKGGKFHRQNMFYNGADVGQIAVAELGQAMNIICENTEKESDIIDIQVNVDVNDERKTASILSAKPDKMVVRPGDTVRISAVIKPYRHAKETVVIPYTVPKTQRDGVLNLDVHGGGLVPATTLLLLQQTGVNLQAADDKTQTTEQKLEALGKTGQNNQIVVSQSAPTKLLSQKETQKLMKEQAEATARAIQAEKNKPKEYNPLKKEEKKTADGTAKVTTKYIIDNVVHTSIKVDHNYKGEKKKN